MIPETSPESIMSRTSLAALAALALLLVYAAPVRADGCVVPKTSPVEGEVGAVATAQRALLWERDGDWDLVIEPRFTRDAGEATWIVPFPVKPEVSAADPTLLDHLEWITSPVFFGVCYERNCDCWCQKTWDSFSGGSETSPSEAEGAVTVWEHGQVGDLDYVILSSADGDSLTVWLDQNGFPVATPLEEALASLDTEDTWFFVSRLTGDLDPAKPLAPIRFSLGPTDAPSYPLRLTRAAMTGDGRLRLTLWVLTPTLAEPWLVQSHQTTEAITGGYSPSDKVDSDWYASRLDEVQAAGDHQEVTRTHAQRLAENVFLTDHCNMPHGWDPDDYAWEEHPDRRPCATRTALQDLGIAVPDGVHPDLVYEMNAGYMIFRYEADLRREALAKDILLSRKAEYGYQMHSVYGWDAGPCNSCSHIDCTEVCGGPRPDDPWNYLYGDEDPRAGNDSGGSSSDVDANQKKSGCSAGNGPASPGWLVLLLLGLVALAVLRRRSATRPRNTLHLAL